MSARAIDVLIVEDDQDLRDAMSEMLVEAGYDAASVGDGLKALEWLRTAPQPPRLILLDLMMPVMDGWQFRDEQRKSPALKSIPVVVLSATGKLTGEEDVECLRKPVMVLPLLAIVERHCGRGR